MKGSRGSRILSRRRLRTWGTGYLFMLPWLVGMASLVIYPMLRSLLLSFTKYNLLAPSRFVGLQNYQYVLHDRVLHMAVMNTLTYSAVHIPLSVILSLFLAFLVSSKEIKRTKFFETIYFLPYVVPLVAVGMMWRWMYNNDYGLVNFVLRSLGIEGPPWLLSTVWVKPAIQIVNLMLIGQMMVIFCSGIREIPRELLEAAEMDGASKWQQIVHVSLPYISPLILFNTVMRIISVLQIFTLPYALTFATAGESEASAGGPAYSSLFYVMYIHQAGFRDLEMGYGSALAWILFVAILGLTLLVFSGSKRWIHYQYES